jgi:hypothetical protein
MTLPIGKYAARAVSADLGRTEGSQDKAPQEVVSVVFEVTAGEHLGARMTWRGWFTEKTMRRTIESLKHCGWLGDWDTWGGLTSEVVQIDVQEDKDIKTGAVRGTRIAWVNPPMSTKPFEGREKNAFTASMRGLVLEVLGPQGAAPKMAPGPAARAPVPQSPAMRPADQWNGQGAEPSADDIPFIFGGWR